jgi:hypothetical protein
MARLRVLVECLPGPSLLLGGGFLFYVLLRRGLSKIPLQLQYFSRQIQKGKTN